MYRVKSEEQKEEEPGEEWFGVASSNPSGSPFHTAWINTFNASQEKLISVGNPFRKLGKSTGDIGGPLWICRRFYSDDSQKYHNRTSANAAAGAYNYLGNYYAAVTTCSDANYSMPPLPSDAELDALGTTAIARVIPTNPLSGLTTTLVELKREGIPSLIGINSWKERSLRARNAGDEYLNYQFGWLPLVNEIQTMAHTVRESDKIIAKYEKESGKLLHRRYTFPAEISKQTYVVNGIAPAPHIKVGYFSSLGTRTQTVTLKVESWFSGAFTYYLPPAGTRERSLAIANKLYGVRLTPEVVWNLTPWSWAADWVSNIGDVMTNISAFQNDGLVMPYGYIMQQVTLEDEYHHHGAVTRYGSHVIDTRQKFTTVVKFRKKATPYGFGLDPFGFSGRQWAILGALGLTRGSSGMKYE